MSNIVSLDEKGRMKIPADMRNAVERLCNDQRELILVQQLFHISIERVEPFSLIRILSWEEREIYVRLLIKEEWETITLLSLGDRQKIADYIDKEEDVQLQGEGATLFNARTHTVRYDNQNRILIPKDIRENIGIDVSSHNILMVDNPITSEIELWNRKIWGCIEKLIVHKEVVCVLMKPQFPIHKILRTINDNNRMTKEDGKPTK